MKILICDDSLMIRRQLKNLILSLGEHEIFEAENGSKAIEVYKKNEPELVYMDIIMPELNGIEAVKSLVEYDKEAKVIMLSSVGTKENLRDALKFGALDFIQKPIEIEVLKKTLDKFSKEV
jgi:two-component system chemotaxis response regulator CheY